MFQGVTKIGDVGPGFFFFFFLREGFGTLEGLVVDLGRRPGDVRDAVKRVSAIGALRGRRRN